MNSIIIRSEFNCCETKKWITIVNDFFYFKTLCNKKIEMIIFLN